MPAAVLPLVAFFTVPCSVPARAKAKGVKAMVASKLKRATARLMFGSALLPSFAHHAAAAHELRSPDQFQPQLVPPRFREKLSSPRSRFLSTCPNEIQIAGPANCRRRCRGAPSADRAWTDAAPD